MADLQNFLQPNNSEMAIGLDLCDDYSQISYVMLNSNNAETLISNGAEGNLLIPTALFKRSEVNQWFAGREAVRNKDEEGYFIENLVSLAKEGENVEIGDEVFAPHALLALYIKRILSLVNVVAPVHKIVSFMITVPVLDQKMVNALNKAVSSLGLKTNNISFQSHMESFYYYMLYQSPDLWKRDVLLLHADGECLKSYRMETNKNTTPVVVFIEENVFPVKDLHLTQSEIGQMRLSDIDSAVSNYAEKLVSERIFSAIYLIGDSFKGDWYKETQKIICRKARVFQGNNLFSKGAAFSAKNKVNPTVVSDGHVFLGDDKLKSNVGMNVLRQGENSYLALLDAGVNWYEAGKECDLILNDDNRLSFVVTPLTGKNPVIDQIILDGLPTRPNKTTRVHVSMRMEDQNHLAINIQDLGFGELFPATDLEWNEVISV
ncbi:MAG: DUF5716 family protein [Lachnospiraceae bacterium]|nr:DUF5716 family protein [Lachnospiraceae bacterium]